MADDVFIYCPDCKVRRYLKDHAHHWDQKTSARKWIQTNCPRGIKRGCCTKLSIKTGYKAQKGYIFGKKCR